VVEHGSCVQEDFEEDHGHNRWPYDKNGERSA
jgi:hypothetical protein